MIEILKLKFVRYSEASFGLYDSKAVTLVKVLNPSPVEPSAIFNLLNHLGG